MKMYFLLNMEIFHYLKMLVFRRFEPSSRSVLLLALRVGAPKKPRFLGLKDSPAGSVALGGKHVTKKRH